MHPSIALLECLAARTYDVHALADDDARARTAVTTRQGQLTATGGVEYVVRT